MARPGWDLDPPMPLGWGQSQPCQQAQNPEGMLLPALGPKGPEGREERAEGLGDLLGPEGTDFKESGRSTSRLKALKSDGQGRRAQRSTSQILALQRGKWRSQDPKGMMRMRGNICSLRAQISPGSQSSPAAL